ncbi:malto-oligosyltrehalose trehalohydrolase [Salinimicrobium sp. MT39]|uniref:Malto-oligosyltrehalose trehalohydrolase n=1 Tax=Salinimicrobium profundisediminis TaxID=2994553 RepID=A0A9X3I0F9_9FLAO|nr:malto-oligosyltrehalose trehalohydrolase [Salinimicrobium profundisediminis]MCX2837398.1 malto-oligosyltrehalose trehalohydrolase [Salinimicrobium profundisediminis]
MGKKVGAVYIGHEKVEFCVWAPFAESVEVHFEKSGKFEALIKDEKGYWFKEVQNIPPGATYKYRIDHKDEFPDPASLSQPQGVHSWSQVVDLKAHQWQDELWKGRKLSEMIIYELHVGTFTRAGTFEAVIDKLDHLEELGINTLELMPIAQFPGARNWGYDGVYPFAAQDSYGGVAGLKKLVDACHARGFSIILDVVYNHLGPEGNYISQYGPYFTDKYHTPWGSALNFDDEYSDQVRHHFKQNALMWLEDFHFDGLRLDAVHEIIDRGARHFLKELSEKTDELEAKTGRSYALIAESDLNDTKLIKDYESGGFGLEGQWVDDFHHALHTVLTGEDAGYYADFGKMEYLAKSFKQAFIYDGIYSPFRKRSIGNNPEGMEPSNFVVCIQNHDQVGNRLLGERMAELVSFDKLKLAAATLLSAPFVPMLFMGEEFGEKNRFQYFISHGDPDLVKAVQEGRKSEFKYFFHSHSDGEFPDPQAEATFKNSKLKWDFQKDVQQDQLFNFYKELIRLKKDGAFEMFGHQNTIFEASEGKNLLKVSAQEGNSALIGIYNFGKSVYSEKTSEKGNFEVLIASADKKWGGDMDVEELLKAESITVPPEAVLIYKS